MARMRTTRVRFWLTDEELIRLNNAVKKSGLSREAYIRTVLNGLVPTDKPPPDFFQMIRELHSIGGNLNQIAKRANSTGDVDAARYERNLSELRQATLRIEQAVLEHRKVE